MQVFATVRRHLEVPRASLRFLGLRATALRATALCATALCATVLTACSSAYHSQPATAATVLPAARATPGSPECELWLHAEQRHQSSNLVTDEIPEAELGVHMVHKGPDGVYASGVCLKFAGSPLTIPGPVTLSTKDFALGDEERFCSTMPVATKEVVRGTTNPVATEVCEWSGQFHAARPFTFIFQGVSGSLARYLQLLQVWRNGELVYRWVPKPTEGKVLVIVGKSLIVRNSMLAASLPPHLSDFDLRIFPAGAEVDEQVLSLKATTEEGARARRWEHTRALALDAVLSQVPAPLQKDIACYVDQLRVLGAKYRSLIAKEELARDPTCADLSKPLEVSGDSLVETYQRLKGAAANEIATAEKAALDELQERSQLLAQIVEAARDELSKKISASGTTAPYIELARRVDSLARDSLEVIDDTFRLARSLRAEGVRLARDPEVKLASFNQFVTQLANSNTIFEARKDNPVPVEGERSLSMEYSDRFQAYLLSPWFGVPVRLSGETLGADLNETAAIPILDLVGLRWQMGKSRFGDIRLGLLGVAAFKEPLPITDPARAMAVSKETEDVFSFAPELSLGFGTFQAGVGYVLTKHDFYDNHNERRVRLFVGADVIKLLFGKNGELL